MLRTGRGPSHRQTDSRRKRRRPKTGRKTGRDRTEVRFSEAELEGVQQDKGLDIQAAKIQAKAEGYKTEESNIKRQKSEVFKGNNV